jgi:hypothetical protein
VLDEAPFIVKAVIEERVRDCPENPYCDDNHPGGEVVRFRVTESILGNTTTTLLVWMGGTFDALRFFSGKDQTEVLIVGERAALGETTVCGFTSDADVAWTIGEDSFPIYYGNCLAPTRDGQRMTPIDYILGYKLWADSQDPPAGSTDETGGRRPLVTQVMSEIQDSIERAPLETRPARHSYASLAEHGLKTPAHFLDTCDDGIWWTSSSGGSGVDAGARDGG